MNSVQRFRPNPHHLLFLGAIAVCALTACATPGSVETGQPPDGKTVDIGYGTADEGSLTGSVSTLRSEDVEKFQPRTMAELLARIPGLRVIEQGDPHPGISVRIRGTTNSILGGEEPLFVLDGMPVTSGAGEIRGMNPNVIESITVLKDAGATAIYGSRGANGVIHIKTKRG